MLRLYLVKLENDLNGYINTLDNEIIRSHRKMVQFMIDGLRLNKQTGGKIDNLSEIKANADLVKQFIDKCNTGFNIDLDQIKQKIESIKTVLDWLHIQAESKDVDKLRSKISELENLIIGMK